MHTNVHIVIQARTSSSRLPAKALLPIGGIPLAVLCAKRAANTGLPVVVATSTDDSDTELASVLKKAGIQVIRGPLDDVLQRFVQATGNCRERDLLVRLTADNPFPDGAFVDSLISFARCRNFSYAGTQSPEDGLPYGLSAEVMTVGMLRQANAEAVTDHDREHVTPWIRRNCSSGLFTLSKEFDLSYLRCTVDSFRDYQKACDVFRYTDDPVKISWGELCDYLAHLQYTASSAMPRRKSERTSQSALTLGTAQLGMVYGRTNTTGKLNKSAAAELVAHAIENGVTQIDTARTYGSSERVVGLGVRRSGRSDVKVITKLAPFDELLPNAPEDHVRTAVRSSVFQSCVELGERTIDTLLLHRWRIARISGGAAWDELKNLRHDGYIRTLGASVQSPEDALEALDDEDVKHLQLPLNILDRRWRRAGVPEKVRQRPDVVVHARSVFLQGVLISDTKYWPALNGVDAVAVRDWLTEQVSRFGRLNHTDLCVAFVRAQDWITSLVLGMENEDQLRTNLKLFERTALSPEDAEHIYETVPEVPESLLNPAAW